MLKKKWSNLISRMNYYGIPLPTLRDPKSGVGSVSLTLLVLASMMVLIGLVGKWSGRLGIIDIHNALEFFYSCAALYFGRNWRNNSASLTSTGSTTTTSSSNSSDPTLPTS